MKKTLVQTLRGRKRLGRPDFTDITHLIINNLGKMAAVNSSKILEHQAQSYLNGAECPWVA